MSRFTSLLVVSPLPDGRSWVLREPLTYDVGREGSGRTVMVPRGFVTDFASVPRAVWWLIAPWGRHGNAAVLHDFLYWSQYLTRAEADRLMLEAMAVLGTPLWTRRLIYRALRLFGWWAWWGNARAKRRGVARVLDVGALPKVTAPVPPRGLERVLLRWLGRAVVVAGLAMLFGCATLGRSATSSYIHATPTVCARACAVTLTYHVRGPLPDGARIVWRCPDGNSAYGAHVGRHQVVCVVQSYGMWTPQVVVVAPDGAVLARAETATPIAVGTTR